MWCSGRLIPLFSRLSKEIHSHSMWISIQSVEGQSRILWEQEYLYLFFSLESIFLHSDIEALGSWAFRLRLTLVINPNPHFLGFSDLWTWIELLYLPTALGFQPEADCGTSPSANLWNWLLYESPLYTFISCCLLFLKTYWKGSSLDFLPDILQPPLFPSTPNGTRRSWLYWALPWKPQGADYFSL